MDLVPWRLLVTLQWSNERKFDPCGFKKKWEEGIRMSNTHNSFETFLTKGSPKMSSNWWWKWSQQQSDKLGKILVFDENDLEKIWKMKN